MRRELWINKKFTFELDNSELQSVLNKLREAPVKINRMVGRLPEEVLIKKMDGKWSIKENIGHLIDLEELHYLRIDDFIEGRHILRAADMGNKKTEKANHNKKDINLLVEEFVDARNNFIKRIEGLDREILTRISLHPRLNQPMRVVDLAQFISEHDDHHIETISDLIYQNQ
jgi:DinB superfamily